MRGAACALGLGLALASAGCFAAYELPSLKVLDSKASKDRPATHLGLPLKSGQIFLTEAPGAYSFVFVLIPDKFHEFTHSSTIVIEDGEAWVYDISGEYVPGFNEHVMDNVEGGMRRTPFAEYARNNLYGEIFDPPEGVDGEKLAAFVKAKYDEGVEFDAYFDYSEHDRLFCTELTNLAIVAAGGKPVPLEPVRDNPSLRTGMKWLGVPLTTALPAGAFKDPSRYVGALGQFRSRTRAYSYFEAKRELHRRFRKDQRLGFLFVLEPTGDVQTRPEIDEFAVRATTLFDDDPNPPQPGDPRIQQRVRALADEMFGPVPADPPG